MNTLLPRSASEDSELHIQEPPDDIRRKTLVLPFLAVGALIGGIVLADLLGAQLNIHGGTGLLVFAAFVVGAIASVLNAFLIPQTIAQLRKHPSLRTPLNYWTLGLGTLLFALFVIWVSYGFIAHR